MNLFITFLSMFVFYYGWNYAFLGSEQSHEVLGYFKKSTRVLLISIFTLVSLMVTLTWGNLVYQLLTK